MNHQEKTIAHLQAENEALRQQLAMCQQELDMTRRTLDLVPVLVYVFDVNEKRNLYVNREIAEILGYTAEEAFEMGESMLPTLMHPDDFAHFLVHMKKIMLLQDDEIADFEYRMQDCQGAWHWFLSRDTVFQRHPDGTPTQIVGTVFDTTNYHTLEDQLRQNQQLFHNVLENMPLAVYVKTLEGKHLFLNEQGIKNMGFPHEAWNNKPNHEILPPEIIETLRQQEKTMLETGQSITVEETIPIQHGLHTYLATRFPIRNNEGEIYAIGGISLDITERKKMAEELHVFKKMIDQSPFIIQMATPDGIFTYGNAASREKFGDIAGKSIPDSFGNPELISEVLAGLMNDQQWSGEFIGKHVETGETFPAHATSFSVEDQTGNIQAFFAIIRDITEQKRIEQERESWQQQIIDAQQSAIRELSSPLIPLSDHVLIMPLVGSIDSRRAQLVMETLLEGVSHYQADMAILDITGVSVVDTQVANALVMAAQAVRLLGAQVILTGIGPTMAQTLVHLGADLSSIVTRGSLQSGIAYAMG